MRGPLRKIRARFQRKVSTGHNVQLNLECGHIVYMPANREPKRKARCYWCVNPSNVPDDSFTVWNKELARLAGLGAVGERLKKFKGYVPLRLPERS